MTKRPCAKCGTKTSADTLDDNRGLCDPCVYDMIVAPSWTAGIARIANRKDRR